MSEYIRSQKVIVVEARMEARLSKLETRTSSINLRVSILASSPLNFLFRSKLVRNYNPDPKHPSIWRFR